MSRYTELSLRVPLKGLPLHVGRSPDADLYLSEATVSRRHARLERRGGQVWVVDLESSHGTFVNEVPIREKALAPEDLIRFGRRVQYRVWPDYLERLGLAGMEIELEGVGLSVGQRVLLEDIHLRIPAGGFVGILGPSGAGKTMLLRLLGGIRPPTTGTIRTNDQENIWNDIEAHRSQLAFIPQKDILYPNLTLQEHLEFSAQLRLGPAISPQERQARIEEALKMLGLQDHADKLVEVLSGGQSKRLSVALEWLRKPKLLLLDEPTAGLDPANEARLMEQLAWLARRGSTVVCATHLMENVRLFDGVAVVAVDQGRGQLAYSGRPEGVLTHFGCRHFADVYEKLETGQWNAQRPFPPERPTPSTPETPPPGTPLPPEILEQHPSVNDNSPAQTDSSSRSPPLPLKELIGQAVEADFAEQFGAVFRRSALVLWRDRWLRWMICAQPIVLAILVSLIQFNPGKLTNLFFFSLVVACWLGMNNSIRDLVRDRRHYIRDRLGGLSPEVYLMAKWLVFGLVGLAQLAVFLLLLRGMCLWILPEDLNQELGEHSLLWWFACLGITYLCGLGLALLISTVVRSEEAAVVWLPILILPQILFSSVATGVSNQMDTDPRPFRPLIITLRYPTQAAQLPQSSSANAADPDRLSPLAVVVDFLSLIVYTRPALVALVQTPPGSPFQGVWLADLAHLVFLLGITYLAMGITFRQAEKGWPVLVGY